MEIGEITNLTTVQTEVATSPIIVLVENHMAEGPPWEITRIGWGEFVMPVVIYYSQDPAVNPNRFISKCCSIPINLRSDDVTVIYDSRIV